MTAAGKRRWRRGLALVAAILLVVVLAVAAVFGTAAGRRWAVSLALDLAPLGELEVTLDELNWPSLGRISLGRFAVADGGGRWLAGEALRLEWQPGALLAGDLVVDRIVLDRLSLLRRFWD